MRSSFVLMLLLVATPSFADRQADWRTDLASLTEQLRQTHPRFSTCGLPAEISAAAASLTQRVGTMSDQRAAVEVQRILAMAGDGHTLLWPAGMQKLPLTLWWFDDGLFVVEGRYAGRRVDAIGGQPIEEVLRRLRPYTSADNEMQFRWAAPFYVTMPAFLEAVGVEPRVTFSDGSVAEVTPEPIDLSKVELRLVPPSRRGETNATRELAPGVLYIAVNSMSAELPAFGRELRKTLARYDSAVVDLRLNNGGDASNADELMKTLIAFDARGGRLVTLISRMTFSAAQTFASRIDQWTETKFVGEPTGSRPNHYGNERPFRLPHTGLRGSISSGWNQPVTSRDTRESIAPDVAVPMLSSDFFAAKDPAIAEALALLRR